MTSAGRVPLWLVALVGGLGVFTVLAVFIYGSYSGLGSSL
jgi:photosystem II PsbJ protein